MIRIILGCKNRASCRKVFKELKSYPFHLNFYIFFSSFRIIIRTSSIQFNSIYFVFDRSKGVVNPQDIEHVNI